MLVALIHDSAQAQEVVPLHPQPDSALRRIVDSMEGSRLELRKAVALALDNSAGVLAARGAWLAARGAARREAGVFDPVLFLTLHHGSQDAPTASFFAGAPVLATTESRAAAGVRIGLPTGTDLEASLSAIRLETNSTFAFLNPQYTTFGTLSLRQPLLGGFFATGTKNPARADRAAEAAQARYDQAVVEAGATVEKTYWDLYAAERDHAVQMLTRERAAAFLAETETRARAGLVGPNQVANARTFLAEQEILLLDREEQLGRISDQLASLIGARPGQGTARYLTVDEPPAEIPVEDVEVLVAQALERNLDLRAAEADVEAGRVLSGAAFWEALPKVDLLASLGGSGLSGGARSVFFGGETLRTTREGTLGGALGQAVRREFPSWSVGLEISVPVGLRAGLGEQERLEAEVAIAEQRRIGLERTVEEQARSSWRELAHSVRRVPAALEGVNAAQEQVRIGLIEFQNGRSTAFELVRLGADYAVAQQRYTQALVRSAKAAAELRRLTSGGGSGR